MYNLFVSCSAEDEKMARAIVDRLEMWNVRCWMASHNVLPGRDFVDEIITAIDECDYFVVLLSEESYSSVWVEKEILLALDKHKYIIPLLIDETDLNERFDLMLKNIQIRRVGNDVEKAICEIASVFMVRRMNQNGVANKKPFARNAFY